MWNFKTNRLHRQTLFAALILTLLSLVILMALRRAEAKRPDVVLYSSEFQMPVYRGALIDRFIPRNWAWASKLRDKIRGKVKLVMIQVQYFHTHYSPEATGQALRLNAPTLARDGTRIWLFSENEGDLLSLEFQIMPNVALMAAGSITTGENLKETLRSRDHHTTAHTMQASEFELETFPRIRGDTVDLISTSTRVDFDWAPSHPGNPVHTNALFATRIQFPTNSSVLILTPDKSSATNRCIALILTAKRQ